MFFEVANVTVPVWLCVSWGVLVGLVFSTVGAAGGILASVGLISVMGVVDPNLVKPMAQALTLAIPVIAVPSYYRQCRVVVSLALLLALGGMIGSIVGSTLSVTYLSDLATFKPIFAALVLMIAVQTAWKIWPRDSDNHSPSKKAAMAFEGLVESGRKPCELGVTHKLLSFARIEFLFGTQHFTFSPITPVFTGLLIATVASALGVGGGFLLVPFMTLLLGLPMFIVAGTAALAVWVSSLTSIANYMRLGVELDFQLLGWLLLGTVIGALIGPRLSKNMPEVLLQGILGVVLGGIGLRYLGFL